MSSGLILLCFVLALPALALAGHDVYLAWLDTQAGKAEAFKFSDVGWLWETYSRETFEWARDLLGKEAWETSMNPFLEMTAFYVAAAPALAVYVLLILMLIFKLGPFSDGTSLFSRGKKTDFAFDSKAGAKKKGQTKYKRK